ncbi:MAG: Hsp33 family molecular chaperone HslO, partial [Granulosicoccaceae bacterium]
LASDGRRNAGLLLQRLPGEDDAEGWNRAEALGGTVFGEELMSTDGPTLIKRLFHEEDVRLYDPRHVDFSCGCSRERCGAMVVGLGAEDARELLLESGGQIDVDCEFCGERYSFDEIDLTALLAGADSGDTLQ